jgi:hypothetical protein
MLMLLTTIIIVIFIVIMKFVLPILKKYFQLQKEYRDITLLPLASIPFLGNVHQLNNEPHVLFQLFIGLTKTCQDQNKGLLCVWYTLWPMVILFSAEGLEVFQISISFSHELIFSDKYIDVYE